MATIFVILIQANDDSLKLVATHIGGSGEIRTHGPFRAGSFQDCCNKPDSATLPKFGTPCLIRTDIQLLLRESALPISVTGHINFLGVCNGERSHSNTFTECGAEPLHYTHP